MGLASKIAKISKYENMSSMPSTVMYGIVTCTNPLKIQNENKLIIDEDFLQLTDEVRDYKTKISFDNPDIKQEYTTWDMGETTESEMRKFDFKKKVKHEITVYNALEVGEKVILLRTQGGQEYVILGRVNAR